MENNNWRFFYSVRAGIFPSLAPFPPQERRPPGSLPLGCVCVFTRDDGVVVCCQPGSRLWRECRLFRRSELGSTVRRALRSEEHTSELQSPDHLVCRLLLEKKKLKGLILILLAD